MSCALTQGFSLPCRDSIGGVDVVYIAELPGLTFTETSGAISAIGKAQGKQFYKYELTKQTAEATEEGTGSEENGTYFYKQTFRMILNRLAKSVRDEIMLLSKNRLCMVYTDKNGNSWLYGRTGGMMLVSHTAKTGVAYGDRNGYELNFEGMEPEAADSVLTSVIATLTTPGT